MLETCLGSRVVEQKPVLLLGIEREGVPVADGRAPLVCQKDADFERFTLRVICDENAPGRQFVENGVRLARLGKQKLRNRRQWIGWPFFDHSVHYAINCAIELYGESRG